jgi:pimeloyl-ACP methyl ester carboxylesterase
MRDRLFVRAALVACVAVLCGGGALCAVLCSPRLQSGLVCLHWLNWPPIDFSVDPRQPQPLPLPLRFLGTAAAEWMRARRLLPDAARPFEGVPGAVPFSMPRKQRRPRCGDGGGGGGGAGAGGGGGSADASCGGNGGAVGVHEGALRGWVVQGASNCSGARAGGSASSASSPPPLPCPAVLYLHGNAGNRAVAHRVRLYRTLAHTLGASRVVALDYGGFGDSGGGCGEWPDEHSLAADARQAWDWMLTQGGGGADAAQVRASDVVIWGHSLGSGIATALVRELKQEEQAAAAAAAAGGGGGRGGGRPLPGGMVLEAPFTSVPAVALSWVAGVAGAAPAALAWIERRVRCGLRSFAFDSESRIASIASGTDAVPTLILAARHDEVIPHRQAAELFAAACSVGGDCAAQHTVVEHATHDAIMDQPEAIAAVRHFLSAVWQNL